MTHGATGERPSFTASCLWTDQPNLASAHLSHEKAARLLAVSSNTTTSLKCQPVGDVGIRCESHNNVARA